MLTSARDLKPGDTFTGKIGIKNGLITINPQAETSAASLKEVITTNILETGNLFDSVASPALASLLASLNLPQDNLSFKMLLQFKQMGMKLDPKTMNKLRREAEKAPDPEKKLEELINEEQKRVKRAVDDGSNFKEQNQENKKSTEGKNQKAEQNNPEQSSEPENTWLSEVKNFLHTVLSGELSNEPAELTVLNHLGFFKDKTSENTWITIPFEITNPFEETTSGNGKILLLMGSSDKNLKQINLHAEYSGASYHFAVFMKPGSSSISRIAFNKSDCQNESDECEKLQKAFLSMGKIISVEYVPYEKVAGYASALENFATAEGIA